MIGGKVFAAMKRSLGAGEWIKRGIGVALLAGVGAIALGLDTGALAQLSTVTTGARDEARRPARRAFGMAHRAHGGDGRDRQRRRQHERRRDDGYGSRSHPGQRRAIAGGAMMRAVDTTHAAAALPVEGTLPLDGGAVSTRRR